MEQGEDSGDDLRLGASLSKDEIRVEALEDKLSAMDSQQSRDMEVSPRKCRAANAELSTILFNMNKLQATTVVTKHKKKAIRKCLDKLMDIIDDKMVETTTYRDRKEEQLRLRDMSVQAKAAQNHKLADLEEQLVYKVMQLCNRLNDAEEHESRIENKGGCASIDRYDQRMLWELLVKKRNQSAIVELEIYTRKHGETNRIAEKLGTKKTVHSTEQDRDEILRAQEVALQELQRNINATIPKHRTELQSCATSGSSIRFSQSIQQHPTNSLECKPTRAMIVQSSREKRASRSNLYIMVQIHAVSLSQVPSRAPSALENVPRSALSKAH